MTDTVAKYSGLLLALLRSAQERERAARAYTKMAGRMAQTSYASVLLAEWRIQSLRAQLPDTATTTKGLEDALKDLNDAREGFDRARLLDIPWCRELHEIAMTEFLHELTDRLNTSVSRPPMAVLQPSTEALRASGARYRLWHAFRDLIVGTWLLGRKEQPAEVRMSNGQRTVRVEITGKIAGRIGGIPRERLLAALDDPETFLSSESDPVERGVSFHLATKLIRDMDGSIEYRQEGSPSGPEPLLRVIVTLPLANAGRRPA